MSPTIYLAIATFITGLFLLYFGFRGRLIGDAPHCRRCRYNLTGQTSQRCPECGTEVTRRSITWGLRKRSPAVRIFAFILLLVATCSFGKASLGVTWIRKVPTSVLLPLASRANQTSLIELRRRYRADLLEKSEKSRLIDAAIRTTKLNTGWRTSDSILVAAHHAQDFSPSQENDYYTLLTSQVLTEFHPRVRQGEAFLVNADLGYVSLLSDRVRVECDVSLVVGTTEYTDFGNSGYGHRNPSVFWLDEAPGLYNGSFEITLDVRPRQKFAPQPLFSKKHKIPFKLEVVSKNAKHQIELRVDQRQAEVLCKRLWLFPDYWFFLESRITPSIMPGTKPSYSEFELRDTGLANMSTAFRVLIRNSQGKEFDVGYWYHRKGAPQGYGEITIDWNVVGDDPVQMILRTDPKVAQKTVDLGAVLEAEITSSTFDKPNRVRGDGVQVERPQFSSKHSFISPAQDSESTDVIDE